MDANGYLALNLEVINQPDKPVRSIIATTKRNMTGEASKMVGGTRINVTGDAYTVEINLGPIPTSVDSKMCPFVKRDEEFFFAFFTYVRFFRLFGLRAIQVANRT